MRYFVHLEGQRLEVEMAEDGRVVRVGGVSFELDMGRPNGRARSVLVGDRSVRVSARRGEEGKWFVDMDGASLEMDVMDAGQDAVRAARGAAAVDAGPTPLTAPMPGLVIRVEVSPGETVSAGQGLLIVEAMKMENELKATAPGRVASVLVSEGETVERNQVLIQFEHEEHDGE